MKAGRYNVRAVDTGHFRLDGGAMFGTVPKALWEAGNPADERNRIDLALRALLAEDGERRILVDAGIGGSVFGPKETDMYAVRNVRTGAADALRDLGVAPEAVTDVVLTHLHFDHAGGVVSKGADGTPVLTFPNAVHWVQRRNLENAKKPNDRERASYLKQTWQVLEDSGRLRLLDGTDAFLPEITPVLSDGHTDGMQVVRIGEGPGAVLYCADLIPLVPHVRVAYTMGYDIHAGLLIEEKRRLLDAAERAGHLLFFEHDPEVAACRLARDRDRPDRVVAGEAVPA